MHLLIYRLIYPTELYLNSFFLQFMNAKDFTTESMNINYFYLWGNSSLEMDCWGWRKLFIAVHVYSSPASDYYFSTAVKCEKTMPLFWALDG